MLRGLQLGDVSARQRHLFIFKGKDARLVSSATTTVDDNVERLLLQDCPAEAAATATQRILSIGLSINSSLLCAAGALTAQPWQANAK